MIMVGYCRSLVRIFEVENAQAFCTCVYMYTHMYLCVYVYVYAYVCPCIPRSRCIDAKKPDIDYNAGITTTHGRKAAYLGCCNNRRTERSCILGQLLASLKAVSVQNMQASNVDVRRPWPAGPKKVDYLTVRAF